MTRHPVFPFFLSSLLMYLHRHMLRRPENASHFVGTPLFWLLLSVAFLFLRGGNIGGLFVAILLACFLVVVFSQTGGLALGSAESL